MKMFTWLIVIAGVLYFGLGAILYLNQRRFIYFPTPASSLDDAQAIEVQNQSETLKVWVLNEGQEQALIYFGGNAESVENNAPFFQELQMEYTVYLTNYRGYGGSTGSPSESALYDDALAIYDRVQSSHKSISVLGRSLGSGVATHVAAERAVDKLVLVAPFDSVEKVAQRSFPMYPMSYLLKDKHDSHGRAHRITSPVLIVIAEDDKVIPRANTERLASAFRPEQLTVEVLPEGTHNVITGHPKYGPLLKDFLQ